MKHILSSAYHPQTNGCVENANGSLKEYIRKWQLANVDKDWKTYLQLIVHQLNSSQHATLGISPYEYSFGIPSWKERSLTNNIVRNNGNEVDDEGEDDGEMSDENLSNVSPLPVIIANSNSDIPNVPTFPRFDDQFVAHQ